MTAILVLFVLGILFLAVEVLVPGGIVGLAGGLMMLAGVVMAFLNFGMGGGLLASLVALTLAGIAFFLGFRLLPRTKLGRRAFLTKEIKGVSAAFGEEARDLIGKSAEALTMLSPTGYVRIDGRRYEAFCQAGQVPAGSALEVIGSDNFRLIVTKR